ncbi:hypothetical protein E0D97_15400 [Oricola cellulosilytica]|uniref:Uncharacterized protein n=1 Tax=Oricola cellulosilytica TaxID=1429082 RepID=A0A4R0P6C7_9HYPH|nr:hypothetical protein E0D97_15400 [Oricola cellulosilytica]
MKAFSIFALVAAVAGCSSTAEDERIEGISFSGGNAIAHNNVLQRIDPWPPGVQDTDLIVPADRPAANAYPAGDLGTSPISLDGS